MNFDKEIVTIKQLVALGDDANLSRYLNTLYTIGHCDGKDEGMKIAMEAMK